MESGVTLGDVFAVASREGLGLPVQPGYPAITIGGCMAANVHGKNLVREGTFIDSVVDLPRAPLSLGAVGAPRPMTYFKRSRF